MNDLTKEREALIRSLRECWSTLHNLSVDMEVGPIRQQLQKRAREVRELLDSIESAAPQQPAPTIAAGSERQQAQEGGNAGI